MSQEKILIVDSKCSFCSKFGDLLEDSYEIRSLYEEEIEDFLNEVFDEEIVDMLLIERNAGKVYIGKEAFNKIVSENSNESLGFLAYPTYNHIRKLLDLKEGRESTKKDEIIEVEKTKIEEYF